jgi:hypothetical protein
MPAREDNSPRRWGIAVGVAALALGVTIFLFRSPKVAVETRVAVAPPPVLLQPADGRDAVFDEAKILFDPTPLFLPTRWNATPRAVARPEPGATFQNYPERLIAPPTDRELKFRLPSPVAVPATSAEALVADSPGSPLLGFGRIERVLPALAPRGAFVEIVAEATGRPVLRQALVDAKPPGEGAWEPMEFLVAVDAAGMVGSLGVSRPSNVEGVDNYFQRYLVQTLRIGQRLAPGFYRICVGP